MVWFTNWQILPRPTPTPATSPSPRVVFDRTTLPIPAPHNLAHVLDGRNIQNDFGRYGGNFRTNDGMGGCTWLAGRVFFLRGTSPRATLPVPTSHKTRPTSRKLAPFMGRFQLSNVDSGWHEWREWESNLVPLTNTRLVHLSPNSCVRIGLLTGQHSVFILTGIDHKGLI